MKKSILLKAKIACSLLLYFALSSNVDAQFTGNYVIRNRNNTSKVIDTRNENSPATIQQWSLYTDQEIKGQQFILKHLGNDVYTIQSYRTNGYVVAKHYQSTDGMELLEWPSIESGKEDWYYWSIKPTTDGYYTIKNVHTGQAIENEKSDSNGKALILSSSDGAAEQQWKFERFQLLGVNDINQSKKFQLYTNPVKSDLVFDSKIKSQVEIYDMTGRLLLKSNVQEGKNVVSLKSLAKGTYIVKFGDLETVKIIKE